MPNTTSTATHFTITAEFKSDWCVGSGENVGKEIDRGIVRDTDGLPYLPFSTLVGLLREMGLSVVNALGNGDPSSLGYKSWLAWHEWLFGSTPNVIEPPNTNSPHSSPNTNSPHSSPDLIRGGSQTETVQTNPPQPKGTSSKRRDKPQPAALNGSSLRLSEELRAAIHNYPKTSADGIPSRRDVVNSLTLVRPGIKINADGRAEEDHLRVDERALSGLVLSADDWHLGRDAIPEDDDIPKADGTALSDEGKTAAYREKVWPALVILQSAAKLLRVAGAKRRRGAGAVTVEISGAAVLPDTDPGNQPDSDSDTDSGTSLKAKLELCETPPAPPTATTVSSGKQSFGANTDFRHVANLDIEILSPVIVDPTQRGNQVESATIIPGAALLPILNEHFGAGLSDLIRSDGIVVTPAYPLVDVAGVDDDIKVTAIPWPLSLAKSKHEKPDDENRVHYQNTLSAEDAHTFKPASGFFVPGVNVSGVNVSGVNVPDINEHLVVELYGINRNASEDRAKKDPAQEQESPGLDDTERDRNQNKEPFSYFGIAPGICYRAEIWSDKEIPTIPCAEYRIGTARRGEFGKVNACITPIPNTAPAAQTSAAPIQGAEAVAPVNGENTPPAIQTPPDPVSSASSVAEPPTSPVPDTEPGATTLPSEKSFVLLATSHWILRTDSGQTATSRAEILEALCRELGDTGLKWSYPASNSTARQDQEPANAEKTDSGENDSAAAVFKVARRESWQSSWGMPRPSLEYVVAGSVFSLKCSKELDISKILARGIGKRRAEGFGRVRIIDDLFLPFLGSGNRDGAYVKPYEPPKETTSAADSLPNDADDNSADAAIATDPIASPADAATTAADYTTSPANPPSKVADPGSTLELVLREAWRRAILRAARSHVRDENRNILKAIAKISPSQLGELQARVINPENSPAEAEERISGWFTRNKVTQQLKLLHDSDAAASHPIWKTLFHENASTRVATELTNTEVAELTKYAIQSVYLEAIRLAMKTRESKGDS